MLDRVNSCTDLHSTDPNDTDLHSMDHVWVLDNTVSGRGTFWEGSTVRDSTACGTE